MNARLAIVALALAEASMFRERPERLKFGYQGGRMRGGKCNNAGNYKKMVRRRKRKGYSY